jgi:hypothetical protein
MPGGFKTIFDPPENIRNRGGSVLLTKSISHLISGTMSSTHCFELKFPDMKG